MRYLELCQVYEKLEATSKRLEKTYFLSELIKNTKQDELETIVLLLQGKVYSSWESQEMGMAARLVIKAISKVTGRTTSEIEQKWASIGDIGKVAELFCTNKKQITLFSSELDTKKVFDNLRKMSILSGAGTIASKVALVSELLSYAKPIEARYIVRTVLEDLRIGVADGTMRDAICWAYLPKVKGVFIRCNNCSGLVPQTDNCVKCGEAITSKNIRQAFDEGYLETGSDVFIFKDIRELTSTDLRAYSILIAKPTLENHDEQEKLAREAYNFFLDKVQEAMDITMDFALIAHKIKKDGIKGLEDIEIVCGKPLKVMLAQKVLDVNEGFEKVGLVVQAEYKYDGFRMQIHKSKDQKVKIFTRRMEDVTAQFPEVYQTILKNVTGTEFILDCEAVGYDKKTGKYTPFQTVSQRIRRKYSITQLSEEYPVEINVFDILYYDGRSLLQTPFSQRRQLIEKIISNTDKKIRTARAIISSDRTEIEEFYKESLKAGNEGIMLKSLDSPYKPGSRVGYMVKLKPVMDTLDLVIVGAEWGEGKRANWYSSFTVACIDEDGNYLELGKVGTGIKEKQKEQIDKSGMETQQTEQDLTHVTFAELTQALKPYIIYEKGKEVRFKPNLVVEIKYEEIQKSPTYNSGFALRFPRLASLRPDRTVEDASSIDIIRRLFASQRHH